MLVLRSCDSELQMVLRVARRVAMAAACSGVIPGCQAYDRGRYQDWTRTGSDASDVDSATGDVNGDSSNIADAVSDSFRDEVALDDATGDSADTAIDANDDAVVVSDADVLDETVADVVDASSPDATVACTFSDNFDSPQYPPFWTVTNGTPPFTVFARMGGQFVARPPGAAGYASLYTPHENFLNGSASMQVVQAAQGASAETYLAFSDSRISVYIDTYSGLLWFASWDTLASHSLSSSSIPYDPVMHRWWRIRSNGTPGTVLFDTAPDGATWTQRYSLASTVDLTASTASIVVGEWDSSPVTASAMIDNFSATYVCP